MDFLPFTSQKDYSAPVIPLQVSREILTQKHYYLSSESDDLEICYVLRKEGISATIVSYEMYDWNSGKYIISSSTFDNGNSFLISNIEDCHRRSSVVENEMNINYLGKVIANNLLRLSFTCYDHANSKICTVDFNASLSSCPLNFKVRIHSDSQLPMVESFKYLNVKDYFRISSKDVNDEEILTTRPPIFNTEVNTFLTNFGGRIKQASFANCIVTSSLDLYKVCIRHGKINSDKFIFDFRSLSKLAAIGIFTSIHINKIFVPQYK